MKKLLGLFWVMLLIFVVSGPVRATGNGAQVSEPSTLILLGAGIIGIAGFGRKRFKK